MKNTVLINCMLCRVVAFAERAQCFASRQFLQAPHLEGRWQTWRSVRVTGGQGMVVVVAGDAISRCGGRVRQGGSWAAAWRARAMCCVRVGGVCGEIKRAIVRESRVCVLGDTRWSYGRANWRWRGWCVQFVRVSVRVCVCASERKITDAMVYGCATNGWAGAPAIQTFQI